MIFLILILALGLRLVNLNQSLWLDEAVQAVTAQKSFAYIFQEIIGDFHPPLYHFLMHYWVRIFGPSEIALRIPSVLFGVGTVGVVYLMIKKLTNSKINELIGALFLATAPFHIYYSQEARMYSMTCFFAAVSMFFFVSKKNVLWFISSILLIYSDYYGFLILLAQIVYLFFNYKFHKYYKFYILLLLFYLPWLNMFIKQIQAGIVATKIIPGWGNLVNLSFFKALPLTFLKFSLGRITIFNKAIYGLAAAGLFLIYGFIIAKGVKGKGVIISWLSVPVLVAWCSSLLVPNYQPFRLLLVLPAFYLLIALGINAFKSRSLRILSTSFVILVNLLSLSRYYFNPYFYREDWRGMVNYIKGRKEAQVILPSSLSNWPIKYYDSRNEINLTYLNDQPEATNLYYIRYLSELFDPQSQILAKLEKAGYTKTGEISFNQITIWIYENRH